MFRFLFCLVFLQQVFANQYDVIVVGGGMSGIAAASKLNEEGYDVLVLEARDHIGGRTHTISLPGHPDVKIDMGAAWIEGVNNNPMVELAKKYGARTKLFNYDSIDLYDTTPPIQPPPLSPMDNSDFYDWEDKIYAQIKKERAKGQEMSLQEALEPWIQTFSEKEQNYIRYILTVDIEQDYGCDCSDLSLLHYDDDDGFGGPDYLMIDGYQPVIDGLAQNLVQKGLIQTGQAVNSITYNEEGVTVQANGVSYTADYVICTVPLGVLQTNTIAFEPPLPDWKLEAMNRLKMGLYDKTVLLFPSVFWDPTKESIGRIPISKGHWVETVNRVPFDDKAVLFAFNAGIEAEELVESKSDVEVIENIMTVLRSIYGEGIPEPIDYVITRWGIDPYSFGSYSHIPPGATIDDYNTMSQPVGRLRFAGEATTTYIATAPGAYMSGIREAKRIINEDK